MQLQKTFLQVESHEQFGLNLFNLLSEGLSRHNESTDNSFKKQDAHLFRMVALPPIKLNAFRAACQALSQAVGNLKASFDLCTPVGLVLVVIVFRAVLATR